MSSTEHPVTTAVRAILDRGAARTVTWTGTDGTPRESLCMDRKSARAARTALRRDGIADASVVVHFTR